MTQAAPEKAQPQLKRELGLAGAVLMGLGSIIGTGVFVSIGIAADLIGAAVVAAIMLAALIATFNGLNSAQLAANHPISGGTYEYGYRYLNPYFGFAAGWTFLLAKSASAATAALGFAGYFLNGVGVSGEWHIPLALGAVVILTLVCLTGVGKSNRVNTFIVSITLLALTAFVVGGLTVFNAANFAPFVLVPQDANPLSNFLYATALMFVAYTGYGRIATLGEEVREPRRTIPRAVIIALIVAMLVYGLVALVSIGSVGASALSDFTQRAAAPLEGVAQTFGIPLIPQLVAIGAVTAMLSVLLNLILGLSRVLLAMGRRGDMPPVVARITEKGNPSIAVVVMGCVIGGLVLIGNVKTTWSFSAFTVLIYYAITNLAALQLKPQERFFPRITAWLGLAACVFLAFQVEPGIWLAGLALIGMGLIWQQIARRLFTIP
jgi:basic amino acid/polyamine antiporter, APA family